MFRLPFLKRKKKPTKILMESFEAAAQEMASKFVKSASFKHGASKGTQREKPIQFFFKQNLPGKYEVVKGEVVDLFDNHSPQIDVMIFDGQRNFAFYYSEENCIIPVEALIVSIEVKSKLTAGEIERSLKSSSTLYKLKPFRLELASRREGGEAADKKCRIFNCIFAYDTDLSKDNWVNKEYQRFITQSEKLEISRSVINRLYVANHGLINLDDERGVVEETNSGTALMHFYMHTLNFLERENRRRQSVPYVDYAGRLSKGWEQLSAY